MSVQKKIFDLTCVCNIIELYLLKNNNKKSNYIMNDLSKAKVVRKEIRITVDQIMRLKEIAEETNVNVSSLIRYAIDILIEKYHAKLD